MICDSHVLAWWMQGSKRVPLTVRRTLANQERVPVSLASLWEIAIKVGKFGRAREPALTEMLARLEDQGLPQPFEYLAIEPQDCIAARDLPLVHSDPFDRMIAVQALRRGLPVVSADPVFEAYGCKRIW